MILQRSNRRKSCALNLTIQSGINWDGGNQALLCSNMMLLVLAKTCKILVQKSEPLGIIGVKESAQGHSKAVGQKIL